MMGVCVRGSIAVASGSVAQKASSPLCILLLSAVAFALLLSAGSNGPARAATPADATSSSEARDDATRRIPWTRLPESQRRDVEFVVKNTSIYRRLPTRVVDCDPDLFTFLLQRPDVVVNVWQLMGISQVSLERVSDQSFRGSDGAGTTGNVRYVYTDWGPDARNLAVVYADGAYDGKPFLTPLRAQSVMLLQSGAVQETDGRRYVTVRVDSFVHIDKLGVELVAKTVQPWLTKTADDNFVQTVDFLSTFSRTAERNPQGMRRMAARLRGVDEPTRGELVRLCFQTSQRYADDDALRAATPLVLAQQWGASDGP
jgi:hypothetical protein